MPLEQVAGVTHCRSRDSGIWIAADPTLRKQ